jgi:hypothetical protein
LTGGRCSEENEFSIKFSELLKYFLRLMQKNSVEDIEDIVNTIAPAIARSLKRSKHLAGEVATIH